MAATCRLLKPWEAPSQTQQVASSRLSARQGLARRRLEAVPSTPRINGLHSQGIPRYYRLACRAVGRTGEGEESGEEGQAGRGEAEVEEERRRRERAEEEELLRALNLDPEDLEEEKEREGGAESFPSPAAEKGEATEGKQGKRKDEEELGKALNLNEIPQSSTQFLAMVSSPAYKMRHRLEQTLTATEFDGGCSLASCNLPRRAAAASCFSFLPLQLLLLLLLHTLLRLPLLSGADRSFCP